MKSLFIVFSIFGLISLAGGYYLLANHSRTASVVHTADIANFKNDRELIGASHDVFVGKILKNTNTISLGESFPGTVFQVEVMDVLKGEQKGIIEVIQVGGCLNGKCTLMAGDILSGDETIENIDNILLKTGETYLLFSRYDEAYGNILIPNIAGKILISSTSSKGIQNNSRYQDIEKAYTEEIIFDGDIKLGWNKNGFTKLSSEKQQQILDRVSSKK